MFKLNNIKILISRLVDLIFGLIYLSIAMPLLAQLLDSSNGWKTLTFGEYFSGSKLWLSMWILSLFYLPIRLLLKGKFWGIIFKKEKNYMGKPINNIRCVQCGTQQMVESITHELEDLYYYTCKKCNNKNLLKKETSGEGEPSYYSVKKNLK